MPSAAEDTAAINVPPRSPDLDEVPEGSCSCLIRGIALRSAMQSGKLRIEAGDPPCEFVFRYVPPGTSRCGLTEEEQTRLAQQHGNLLLGHNAIPAYAIEFGEGFFLLEREVTRGQFQAVQAWGTKHKSGKKDASESSSTPKSIVAADEGHPQSEITWHDAYRFCSVVRQETAFEIRLPTEEEWEYAARGPVATIFAGGDRPPQAYFDGESNAGYSAVIGESRLSVALGGDEGRQDISWCGVRDLSGNLSEWCLNEYRPAMALPIGLLRPSRLRLPDESPAIESTGRAVRGASFRDPALAAAASLRRSLRQSKARGWIGLRPVLTLYVDSTGCPFRSESVTPPVPSWKPSEPHE